MNFAWLFKAIFCFILAVPLAALSEVRPIRIGITAEFGVTGSHAAQSIERGIRVAIAEVNAAGGIRGRPLALEVRDDRGLPARAVENFKSFADEPDVVAVFCGRFSPVAMELAPLANQLGLLLLDPWAAADPITRQPSPNYVFRLSLTDTWAINVMLDDAGRRGFTNVAMLVPNTSWGRSSVAAAQSYIRRQPAMRVAYIWYNWGDSEFAEKLVTVRAEGAQALLMVANELEGALVVRQIAAMPSTHRLPVIAHWGILAGDFASTVRQELGLVDLSVVHTFSFTDAPRPQTAQVIQHLKKQFGVQPRELHGQVGFAHAYDFTHLLAIALKKAGGGRSDVRTALEQVGTYEGLLGRYQRPFSPDDHEALSADHVRLGRYDSDGQVRQRLSK